ncbi:hypothetical protein [Actinomadura litoris]|uniref:hypothetical protein n=1 Tax=Actinomadura litoris TaxID=2678616 RepID=UPI001FA6B7CF|nr:hypothetical protein [Actinomadura litoris]
MTTHLTDYDRELAEVERALESGQAAQVVSGESKVTFDPRWWGFHLLLNRHAVKKLLDKSEEFVKDAKKAAGKNKKAANLIELYILIRKVWVQAIDKGTGIRFTSPWLAPGALVPTVWYDGEEDPPPKPPDPGDTALRWTVWEPGQSGWSEDRVIPGHKACWPRRWPPTATAPSTACTAATKAMRSST